MEAKHEEILELCDLCLAVQKTESIISYPSGSSRSLFVYEYKEFHHQIKYNQLTNATDDSKVWPIMLQSNKLIQPRIAQELKLSIEPLQEKQYNYRDSRFINASEKNVSKPKLQEIIYQYEHFSHYKQLKSLMEYYHFERNGYADTVNIDEPKDKDIVATLCPAIFSLKELRFKTEINGLLHKNNIELYTLIEQIFVKFIPMFEALLNTQILNNPKYEFLRVIIKIQDYQFSNENGVVGRWHNEGTEDDDISAIGLYYFDVAENDELKFMENGLDLKEKHVSKYSRQDYSDYITHITENDCIVFKNEDIKHRGIISTERTNLNEFCGDVISRKFLSFFLIQPSDSNKYDAKHQPNNYKWINFPWKVDILVKGMVEGDFELGPDVIVMIEYYAFGNDEYKYKQKIDFRENRNKSRKMKKSMYETESDTDYHYDKSTSGSYYSDHSCHSD